MADFGKMIDKLIEISTSNALTHHEKMGLDEVIDELIHLEIDKNGSQMPDFSDLSPEEMEEIKQFELFVRDVMNNKLALA